MKETQSGGELPEAYMKALNEVNLNPLWPSLRALLPFGRPSRNSVTSHWRYTDIRPLLMKSGELTPIERAERRVLVLCNPGLGLENLRATPSIYVGLQLILPGEAAPNHRHSPSAIRLIVEGGGGYTTVEGEKLSMEPGDLILTPSGLWHEHGHGGTDPVVWMDALDLPLIYFMEASYGEEAAMQDAADTIDASQTRFTRAGLLPYSEIHSRQAYPMLRYPWRETRESLISLSRAPQRTEAIHLAYVNPVTGLECLPVLGFSALMLRPGEELQLKRRSCSQVFHAVEGAGTIEIDGDSFNWETHDISAIPPHSEIRVYNRSSACPAFLFMVDDAPLHRKMRIYQEFDW